MPHLPSAVKVASMPLTPVLTRALRASSPRPPSAAVASSLHRRHLFEACLPWMVGTHVMGRMIAQLVCYSVLPELVKDTNGGQLEGLFYFLRDNPDMVRWLRPTQSTRLPNNWSSAAALQFVNWLLPFLISALGLPSTALCGLACSYFLFLWRACLLPMALQIKMRERQLETFNQTDCVAMCTVSGMLEAHGTRSDGEITPTHMCELLQQVRLF